MTSIPLHSQQLLPTNVHANIIDEFKHLHRQRQIYAQHDDKVFPFYDDTLEPFMSLNEYKWIKYGLICLIILVLAFIIITLSRY